MERLQIILKNSIVSLGGHAVSMVIQSVLRKVLLMIIGIEILGISGAVSSVLSTLALTELGFHTAVVYQLYAPMRSQDYEKINKILSVFRMVYIFVGTVFFCFSIVSIPLLNVLLTDVSITRKVVVIYLLMSINVVSSYFFSYRRVLLYADQREYIAKIIDSFCNVVFCAFKIWVVLCFRNYSAFLILQILQTIVSNLLVCRVCKKRYPYIVHCRPDRILFGEIFKDVKNIFMGKIAGYVYGATDNLIISSFIGVIKVGFFSNYTMIMGAIRSVISALFYTMTPVVGNMLQVERDKTEREQQFRVYSHIRCIFAAYITSAWLLLANDLVLILFGREYVMENMIVVLMGMDLYIDIAYSGCCEYISGAGLFQADKYIAVIGALINLFFSILLVKNMGLAGVLIGTTISQMFFWIGRSIIVYRKVLNGLFHVYLFYLLKNAIWICILCVVVSMVSVCRSWIKVSNHVLQIFYCFLGFTFVYVATYFIAFSWTEEGRATYRILKKFLKRG